MQSSNVIVAINKDANAPIFEFSDLGVVGDVHEIVPKLTELVNAAQGRVVAVRASDYPPPFDAREFVAEPTDPADERIEVGILIVGAGPAGLACAIRLGQLLEEHPDVAERLGEVPVARRREGQAARLAPALRRGRQPARAAASLQGPLPRRGPAVVRPGARRGGLRAHARRSALRIPPPPTMRNHGNWIFSLSQLGRWLGERAEEGGAMILPETAAEKLLVSHGRVVGIRTGDKGREPRRRADGQLRARRRPRREGDRARRGNAGPSHRRRARPLRPARQRAAGVGARREGGLEACRSRCAAIVHTMGWPLRTRAKYREFGGSFIYPMGDDMLTIGMVVGLDYRDVELSRARSAAGAEDAPEDPQAARRRRAHRLGREDDPERRLPLAAAAAARARPAHVRRRRRHGQHPAPQGRALRDRVGPPRRRVGVRGAAAAARRLRPRSRSYDDGGRARASSTSDLDEVRDMRQVFGRGFFVGGALASAMTVSKGRLDLGKLPRRARRRAAAASHRPRGAAIRRPTASSRSTSSRRSSSRGTRRATTSRTTFASSARCRATSRRCGCTCARRRCTRSAPRAATAPSTVQRRAVELRPVRRDHREGRPPDAARGRLRARVHAHVAHPFGRSGVVRSVSELAELRAHAQSPERWEEILARVGLVGEGRLVRSRRRAGDRRSRPASAARRRAARARCTSSRGNGFGKVVLVAPRRRLRRLRAVADRPGRRGRTRTATRRSGASAPAISAAPRST